MKVFAGVSETHDGIQQIKLFASKCDAKTYIREQNRELGFDYFSILELEVHNTKEK